MKFAQDRRRFLKQCSQLGFSCFSLYLWNKRLLARTPGNDETKQVQKAVDLKKRSYCGIACEDECELYKATRENDVELKKKVYEGWRWKEKFGFDFDPEKVFCYTCKPGDQALKPGMADCEVRQCAMANEIESCIQCSNLAACDKEFWKQWGDFYNHVKESQKQYLSNSGAALIDIKKPDCTD